MSAITVLIVDDESLARSRLRTLLGDCVEPKVYIGGEAQNAAEALALLKAIPFDAVFLDIHMPGGDGLALANSLKSGPMPPAIVFVTAHNEHAVDAFELAATDYLTKPVRLERLQKTLLKIEQHIHINKGLQADLSEISDDFILIQDRGITERVPLHEVLYLKAELKYISVRTAVKTHLLEGSLSELEARYASYFLRIHRNALVAKSAIRALEKQPDHGGSGGSEGEAWAVRLTGIDDMLQVSRRQLAAVKEVMAG